MSAGEGLSSLWKKEDWWAVWVGFGILTFAVVAAALDLGINFIDTANVYQDGRSEETLGQALKGRWDRFVVATKFYFPMGEGPNDKGASRYHMLNAVEASLRRLENDYIDLYQPKK